MQHLSDTYTAGLDSFQKKLDDLRATSVVSTPTLETLSADFSGFRDKIQDMLGSLMAKYSDLEYRVQELEAKGRRNTILIHGIKEDPVVSPTTAALSLIVEKLGCSTISAANIDACYRLGAANAQRKTPRPIVVKFARRDDRYRVWNNKKVLKGSRTLITESLIRPRQILFTEARAIFKVNNSWTSDGRIIVMFPDGQKEVITRPVQLQQAKSRLATLLNTEINAPSNDRRTRSRTLK